VDVVHLIRARPFSKKPAFDIGGDPLELKGETVKGKSAGTMDRDGSVLKNSRLFLGSECGTSRWTLPWFQSADQVESNGRFVVMT
jgi:hypothetical protein